MQNFFHVRLGDGFQQHLSVVGLRSKDALKGLGLSKLPSIGRSTSNQLGQRPLLRSPFSRQDVTYRRVPITNITDRLDNSVMSHSIASIPRMSRPDNPVMHHRLALVKSLKKSTLRTHVEKLVSEEDSYSAPSWLRSDKSPIPALQRSLSDDQKFKPTLYPLRKEGNFH